MAGKDAGLAEIKGRVEDMVASYVARARNAEGKSDFKSFFMQEGLARRIADIVAPAAISTRNAKRILEAMAEIKPKTDYEVAQDLKAMEGNEGFSRPMLGGESDAAKIKKILAGMGLKDIASASDLTDDQIRAVMLAWKNQSVDDIQAAREVISAA